MKIPVVTVLSLFFASNFSHNYAQVNDYPIQPISFTNVNVTGGFWRPRLESIATVTIPYAFKKCEETGRVNNFIYAAGIKEGKFQGDFGFDDSDVYKILEGASYSLMTQENPALRAYIDTLVSYIAGAQEEDGYLYTPWTLKANDYAEMTCCSYDESGERFINGRWSHELYNVGHMYEAAVAHYQATGAHNFLDIATKNADLIYQLCVIDNKPFYPGHQEIELGLVKLYRVTGKNRYLELAKLFLDRRGTGLTSYTNKGDDLINYDIYSQDHKPVIDQKEAMGHSVRAVYMYAAMADIAAITADKQYLAAIDQLWEDIVGKKMYITGGLGAGNGIEGFDKEYELPNDAYAETCAAIANVYWNHRMFLLHGDSKYIDVMERTLYNGLIAGLSMDGDLFFYPNPLVFDGKEDFNQGALCRSSWFNCSCCPSNLSRFVPSLAGYTYAIAGQNLFINLYMKNTSSIDMGNQKFTLTQSTDYPWSGNVVILVDDAPTNEVILNVRIPGWAQGTAVPSDLYKFTSKPGRKTEIKVNGEIVDYQIKNGYAPIAGNWRKGDRVEIEFPMKVYGIRSHPKVNANKGKQAYQRGPILFCAEGSDNHGHGPDLHVNGPSLKAEYQANFLNGVTVLKGTGSINKEKVPVKLIPYYSWSHREISPMAVWLGEE